MDKEKKMRLELYNRYISFIMLFILIIYLFHCYFFLNLVLPGRKLGEFSLYVNSLSVEEFIYRRFYDGVTIDFFITFRSFLLTGIHAYTHT